MLILKFYFNHFLIEGDKSIIIQERNTLHVCRYYSFKPKCLIILTKFMSAKKLISLEFNHVLCRKTNLFTWTVFFTHKTKNMKNALGFITWSTQLTNPFRQILLL